MGAHYKGWREADAWARFWKGTSTAQDQASGLVAEEAVLGLTAGVRTAETDQRDRGDGRSREWRSQLGGEARRLLTASRRPRPRLEELGWAPRGAWDERWTSWLGGAAFG